MALHSPSDSSQFLPEYDLLESLVSNLKTLFSTEYIDFEVVADILYDIDNILAKRYMSPVYVLHQDFIKGAFLADLKYILQYLELLKFGTEKDEFQHHVLRLFSIYELCLFAKHEFRV